MREALADVGRRALWTEEQRRALRSAFQAIVDAFDGVLLLRGKRITVDGVVSSGALSLTVDCPFKPKTVQVLLVSSVDWSVGNYPLTWVWSGTPTSGAVAFTDTFALFAALGDGTYTFDIFMEKS